MASAFRPAPAAPPGAGCAVRGRDVGRRGRGGAEAAELRRRQDYAAAGAVGMARLVLGRRGPPRPAGAPGRPRAPAAVCSPGSGRARGLGRARPARGRDRGSGGGQGRQGESRGRGLPLAAPSLGRREPRRTRGAWGRLGRPGRVLPPRTPGERVREPSEEGEPEAGLGLGGRQRRPRAASKTPRPAGRDPRRRWGVGVQLERGALFWASDSRASGGESRAPHAASCPYHLF